MRVHLPSALAGAAAWLVLVAMHRLSPFDVGWAHALLLFAPLVLVPLALRCFPLAAPMSFAWRTATILQLPAVLLLTWSFLTPQGNVAAALSLPWLAVTGLLAMVGLSGAWRNHRGPLAGLSLDVALVYLAIGAFWTTLDRWGQRPLDFEPVIVLLTGIHFHYAGFMLLVLTALAMRQLPGRLSSMTGIGVIVAVPLTAVGITASQLGYGSLLEALAAWFMALAGISVGVLYCRLGLRQTAPASSRSLFLLAGLALLAGMGLAGLYGARFYCSIPWLDIPWMRALHGSLNALGFSLAGIVGWQFHPSISSLHMMPP